jgi:hypothetical protein
VTEPVTRAVLEDLLGNGTYSKATPAGSFPLYLYKWSQPQGSFLPSSTAYGQSG